MEDFRKALWPNANQFGLATQADNSKDEDDVNEAEKQFKDFQTAMKTRLEADVLKLKKHKLSIPWRGEKVELEDIAKKFVGVVASAQGFVGQALSTNPQAALAWAGVCFGLQVRRQYSN